MAESMFKEAEMENSGIDNTATGSRAAGPYDHEQEMMSLARRALHHLQNKTTDQAGDTMSLSVQAYIDPERYEREVEQVFKRLPLALAMSLEVPEPGSYRAMTTLGVPLIIVRGNDGKVRAFINACRHRGAQVCKEGEGRIPRFVCPYHAWQYDLQGKLSGVYGANTFGEVSAETHSLTPLWCEERSGLIWVCLTPALAFDIDEWLGDFSTQLDTLELGKWHIYEQREIDGPGWKVAWDGYLEAYHHNTLHANTVGKYTIGNLMLQDVYGPHQRITFGRRTLKEMLAQDESEWEPEKHLRMIHSVFPNVSISGVLGDHCLVSQVFPGPTMDRTITRQLVLSSRKPETPQEHEASAAFSATVLQAVQDEDYAVGLKVQAGIRAGGNSAFTFGRNEPAIQHYHQWVSKIAARPIEKTATTIPIYCSETACS
jgi:phenylpropionate dioxygenase-like ring-hydroxylating dioxygenase large terminal subunit